MPESLRQQFGQAPTYEDYAAEIAPRVVEYFGKDAKTN